MSRYDVNDELTMARARESVAELAADVVEARARNLCRRAEPHATNGFVDVDPTRTYLVLGVFTESMVGLTAGQAPRALVRADLTGRWNHGAEDKPVLVITPETAREWGATLVEAADAAEADLAHFLRTRRATT